MPYCVVLIMIYRALFLSALAARGVTAQGILDSVFSDPTLSSLTNVYATATDPAVQASASSEIASRVDAALSTANGSFGPATATDTVQLSDSSTLNSGTQLGSATDITPSSVLPEQSATPQSQPQLPAITTPTNVPGSAVETDVSLPLTSSGATSLAASLTGNSVPVSISAPRIATQGAGTAPGTAIPLSTPITTNASGPPAVSATPVPFSILSEYAQSFQENPGVKSLSNLWATVTDSNVREELSAGISQVFALYMSAATAVPPDAIVTSVEPTNGNSGLASQVAPPNAANAAGMQESSPGLSAGSSEVTAQPVANSQTTVSTITIVASTGTITLTSKDTGAAVSCCSSVTTATQVSQALRRDSSDVGAGNNASNVVNDGLPAGRTNRPNTPGSVANSTAGAGGRQQESAGVPPPLATGYVNGNPNENSNGGNLSGGTLGGNGTRSGNRGGSNASNGGNIGNTNAGNSNSSSSTDITPGGGNAINGGNGNGNGSQPPPVANAAKMHTPVTLPVIFSLLLVMLNI